MIKRASPLLTIVDFKSTPLEPLVLETRVVQLSLILFISLLVFMPFRVQRNEPAAKLRRKYSLLLDPLTADYPALHTKADDSESRTTLGVFIPPCGILRRIVSPLFVTQLGCMKWR